MGLGLFNYFCASRRERTRHDAQIAAFGALLLGACLFVLPALPLFNAELWLQKHNLADYAGAKEDWVRLITALRMVGLGLFLVYAGMSWVLVRLERPGKRLAPAMPAATLDTVNGKSEPMPALDAWRASRWLCVIGAAGLLGMAIMFLSHESRLNEAMARHHGPSMIGLKIQAMKAFFFIVAPMLGANLMLVGYFLRKYLKMAAPFPGTSESTPVQTVKGE